jgi:hypothetical protein
MRTELTRTTAAALSAALLALAGCGGSSNHAGTTATTQSTPATSTATTAPSKTATGPGKTPPAKTAPAHARTTTEATGGAKTGGVAPGGVPPVAHPCSLVTAAEAQAAAHAQLLSKTEAPLGPTCIFRFRGGPGIVTLTVEAAPLAKLSAHLRSPMPIHIGSYSGLCGTLGRPMLFLALSRSRTLNVTTACPLAGALAAKAIARL